MNGYIPHGPCFATATAISPWQACRLIWHSLRSCTPSVAQTGLGILEQVGQIHCTLLSTTLQPILYGARHPWVKHRSAKSARMNLGLSLVVFVIWIKSEMSLSFYNKVKQNTCGCRRRGWKGAITKFGLLVVVFITYIKTQMWIFNNKFKQNTCGCWCRGRCCRLRWYWWNRGKTFNRNS